MGEARFGLAWQLAIEHEDAQRLADALAPETGDYAQIRAEDDRLIVEGEGSAGTSLHTLDDLLACLTGAVDVLDETDADEDDG